jgi:O-phosphoseryl-tRNA synthetase
MVYEPDPNVRLVGPAAFNEIVIHGASILGIPEKGMDKVDAIRSAREKGVRTGVRYVDSVAKAAALRVERDGKMDLRVRMAKLPSDVNIRLSEVGVRYVSSRQGKIDVRGPAFIGIRSEVLC